MVIFPLSLQDRLRRYIIRRQYNLILTLVEVHSEVDCMAGIYSYQHGRVLREARCTRLIAVFFCNEMNMLTTFPAPAFGLPL